MALGQEGLAPPIADSDWITGNHSVCADHYARGSRQDCREGQDI